MLPHIGKTREVLEVVIKLRILREGHYAEDERVR